MADPFTNPVLAVDLGGTKVAVAIVSPDGKVLARLQEATHQGEPQQGIIQISHLLAKLLDQNHLEADEAQCIGIGIPAVLQSGTDLVIWAPNLKGWRNVDLRGALEQKFNLPVFIEYDGHTSILGEWWVGGGRGYNSIVNVIIGTGIGGGMILDGHLYRGKDRLAGAAGWFALTTEGNRVDQNVRSFGHWETLAAGPGFIRYVQSHLASYPDSSIYTRENELPLSAESVFQAAQQGDAFSIEMTNSLAGWVGLGLANIISLLNPEIIILGGGIGSNCDFILPHIEQVARNWSQPAAAKDVIIAISHLGTDAGLLGAAYGAILRKNNSNSL